MADDTAVVFGVAEEGDVCEGCGSVLANGSTVYVSRDIGNPKWRIDRCMRCVPGVDDVKKTPAPKPTRHMVAVVQTDKDVHLMLNGQVIEGAEDIDVQFSPGKVRLSVTLPALAVVGDQNG